VNLVENCTSFPGVAKEWLATAVAGVIVAVTTNLFSEVVPQPFSNMHRNKIKRNAESGARKLKKIFILQSPIIRNDTAPNFSLAVSGCQLRTLFPFLPYMIAL
jgi:hypothetical protein